MNKIDELRKIGYFAYVIVDDVLWVSNKRYNGLYSIDINTGETRFHGRFERYSYDKLIIHSYAGQYKNYIFFLPQLGDSIDIYDINTGNIQSVVIEQWENVATKAVAGYVQVQDSIYIIPKAVEIPILKFSFKNMQITKYIDIPEMDFLKTSKYGTLTCNIASDQSKIWLAIYDYCCVLEVDINSASTKVFELPDNYKLHSIGFDGTDLWISNGLSILQWNPKEGIVEEYKDVLTDLDHELNAYSDFVFWNDYVYGIPQWTGKIVRINKCSKEVSIIDANIDGIEMVKDGTQNWRHHRDGYIWGNELIINPVSFNKEIHINLETDEILGCEYLADKESVYIKRNLLYENEYSLDVFINAHVMPNASERGMNHNNVGEKIYRIINS